MYCSPSSCNDCAYDFTRTRTRARTRTYTRTNDWIAKWWRSFSWASGDWYFWQHNDD